MRQLKVVAVLGVLAGALIFGAVVAHGSWWWNSTLNVEGVELRTIWEITDSTESLYSYSAAFTVIVPSKAEAAIIETGTNETVTIKRSKKLACLSNGVQVRVDGKVSAEAGATGTQAKITLTADGVVVGEKAGAVGQTISQQVLLPTNGVAC